jgi:hypothetical protein
MSAAATSMQQRIILQAAMCHSDRSGHLRLAKSCPVHTRMGNAERMRKPRDVVLKAMFGLGVGTPCAKEVSARRTKPSYSETPIRTPAVDAEPRTYRSGNQPSSSVFIIAGTKTSYHPQHHSTNASIACVSPRCASRTKAVEDSGFRWIEVWQPKRRLGSNRLSAAVRRFAYCGHR